MTARVAELAKPALAELEHAATFAQSVGGIERAKQVLTIYTNLMVKGNEEIPPR